MGSFGQVSGVWALSVIAISCAMYHAGAGLLMAIRHAGMHAARTQKISGTAWIYHSVPRWFSRWYVRVIKPTRFGRVFERIRLGLGLTGVAVPDDALCFASLLSMTFASGLALLSGNMTLTLLAPAVGISLLGVISERFSQRYLRLIVHEVPHALRAIMSCVQTGATLEALFLELSQTLVGPLQSTARHIHSELVLGGAPRDALKIWLESDVEQLRMVALALVIQHETGGSLSAMLVHAIEAADRSLELQAKLRSQTAQARLSAQSIIGVSIGLIALIALFVPDFLQPFLSSIPGMILLGLAIGMQVAGLVIVRRQLMLPGV